MPAALASEALQPDNGRETAAPAKHAPAAAAISRLPPWHVWDCLSAVLTYPDSSCMS
jgi:hypothetical protein